MRPEACGKRDGALARSAVVQQRNEPGPCLGWDVGLSGLNLRGQQRERLVEDLSTHRREVTVMVPAAVGRAVARCILQAEVEAAHTDCEARRQRTEDHWRAAWLVPGEGDQVVCRAVLRRAPDLAIDCRPA